tara:strand:+ start:982 stop:1173 length:192 start_codon:yes stop_codon:yes gene_type:complete
MHEHDNEDSAIECCPPEVESYYTCPECGEEYATEEQAIDCCGYVEPPPTAEELESAGQGRLIP